MPIHTLRPVGLSVTVNDTWTASGASTVLAAITSTGNSYGQSPSSGLGTGRFSAIFAAWQPPSGSHITAVRWIAYAEMNQIGQLEIRENATSVTAYSRQIVRRMTTSANTEQTLISPWRSVAPDGRRWGDYPLTSLRTQVNADMVPGGPTRLRVYQVYLQIEYTRPPNISYVGPTGTVADNATPTIEWDYDHPDGLPQARARVVLNNVPFGWQSGDETSFRIPDPLEDGSRTARVESQVQAPDGTWVEGRASGSFTVDLDRPATPGLTVTPHNDEGRTLLEIEDLGHSSSEQLLESPLNIASSDWLKHGEVPIDSGGMWEVPDGVESWVGQPVELQNGREYLLTIRFRLHTPGTVSMMEARVGGSDPTSAPSAYTTWELSGGLASYTFRWTAQSGQSHVWVGFPAQFGNGAALTWTSSNLRTVEVTGDVDRFEIDYWDIRQTPSGSWDVEWLPLRGGQVAPDSDGTALVWDHEAPIRRTRRYRVRGIIEHEGATVTSEWALVNGVIDSPSRWLTDPRDPENLHAAIQISEHSRTLEGRDEVHTPAGMDVSVVESEPPTLRQTISIWSLDEDTWEALWRVFRQSRTLLYRDWRQSIYVRLVGDRTADQYGLDHQETDVFAATMVEVPKPPVDEE